MWLQLGRGFEAAETRSIKTELQAASLLQLGRGFEAAETFASRPVAATITALQLGRGFEAAETSLNSLRRYHKCQGFN